MIIYFWLQWFIVAAGGLFSNCVSRGYSLLLSSGAWASHCCGFSCCGAQAAGTQDYIVVAHGLSSLGMCNLPRPGTKPVSALAGRFLTTGLPGKSPTHFYFVNSANAYKSQVSSASQGFHED